jgi:hypothetical protein
MRSAQKLAEDYIEVWNELHTERRRALLSATWAHDATYVDPLMQAGGQDQVDGMIAAVHQRFPKFRFFLLGSADSYADFVRFSWGLGPDGSEPVVKGTDFVRRQGDLIASVTGFIDQMPPSQ